MYSGRGFFGANDGCVYEMEFGGSDDGQPYTANYIGAFDHCGTPGQTKTFTMARGIFRAASPINPKISASKNYAETLPTPPSSPANFTTSEWDSGLWDDATWDAGGSALAFSSPWVGIGVTGYAIAPQVQLTYGVTPSPRAELVAFDLVYESGGIVV